MSEPFKDTPHTVEIDVPGRPTADQMAALGELAGSYGWGKPEARPLVPEQSLGPNPLFEAEPQARLDVFVRDLTVPDESRRLWGNVVGNLRYAGLFTVRDALVVGLDPLLHTPGRSMGDKSINLLTAVLLKHFPEVPFTRYSDPARTARLCPTLGHVTWCALQQPSFWLPGGNRTPSVEDILTTPYQDLRIIAFPSKIRGIGISEQEAQSILTDAAVKYAKAYAMARAAYT